MRPVGGEADDLDCGVDPAPVGKRRDRERGRGRHPAAAASDSQSTLVTAEDGRASRRESRARTLLCEIICWGPPFGQEAAAARRIGWSIIRIPSPTIKIVEHGIVEQGRPGGKGLRRSECIADGVEFTIRANVPTSVLAVDEFLRMLRVGGQFVGLSPGRSAGFGDFEVLEAE